MNSHLINMLISSLIISTSFHTIFFDKRKHRWHHHFWLYFGVLFAGSLILAWLMYFTEPKGYFQ